jgi:hypothetical protein
MKKSNLKTIKNKGVNVELGGNEYVLKFDLNAFAELEDVAGNINDVLISLETGSIKAIRALLWAGLQSNENAPTLKEVGSMITITDIQDLSTKLNEALGISLPEADEQIDPN